MGVLLGVKRERKYKDFGQLLRKLRKKHFNNIEDFSKAAKIISKSEQYEYESGRVFPPINKFIRICEILNKSPGDLLSPLLKWKKQDNKIIEELIERVKYVCKDGRNIDRLDGFLASLEQEIKKKKPFERGIH